MTGPRPLGALVLLAAVPLVAAAAAAVAGNAATPPGTEVPVLRFAEMVRHPIGPRGLEPTPRLLGLEGARVRVVGFVVARPPAETAAAFVVLTPRPVRLDDEDEGLADDLPANAVHVHPAALPAEVEAAARCKGPVGAEGTLELGARREADDRISYVRLTAASLRCLAPPAPAATR